MTLEVYNAQLEHLENQDASSCARELSGMRLHLRSLRLSHRTNSRNGDVNELFQWALPIVDAAEEDREEFFGALVRLLERQTSSVCRVRIIALLLELSAIELAPPSSDGGSGSSQSFGHHALRVVRDLLPNVSGIRDVFLSCVEDPFVEIIASMSQTHLISLFPLLLDLLSDPYFTSQPFVSPEEVEANLFALMSKTAPVFTAIFLNLLSRVTGSDGLGRADARTMVWSLQQCGRVLLLLCQSPISARAIHGDGVFTDHLFSSWQLFRRLDSDERWSHDCFTFFRLLGALARGCPESAEYLSGGAGSVQSKTEMVVYLIGMLKSIPNTPNNDSMFALGQGVDANVGEENLGGGGSGGPGAGRYSVDSFNASLIYCLNSLLLHSDRACTILKDRKEGMKSPKDFHTRLFRWIHSYENGDFISSCIDGLVVLTKATGLRPFRIQMEERNTLCHEIQRMFGRLFNLAARGKINRTHRPAMLKALEFMTHYSGVDKIASGLNHTLIPDFDRLSILQRILRHPGEGSYLIDSDVKLAAARCLDRVSLQDLNGGVVGDIIQAIKDAPPTMAPAMTACMTRLLAIAFRMAMYEPEGDDEDDEDGSAAGGHGEEKEGHSKRSKQGGGHGNASAANCGDLFRKDATEAFAALYATLEHGIVDDRSPVRVDALKIKYRLAIVKVLMSAWAQPSLREASSTRSSIDVMVKSCRSEQNALRWIRSRHARLRAQGRCVDCEEELNKNSLLTPTRTIGAAMGTDDLPLPGTSNGTASGASGTGTGSGSSTSSSEPSIINVLHSIRCPRCSLQARRGRTLLSETYTPLYLEQTWGPGHNIRAVLEVLSGLKEVDLIAFRVLHQGANILEGTTLAPNVKRLAKLTDQEFAVSHGVDAFQLWNESLPGRSVEEARRWERGNWAARQAKIRARETKAYPIYSIPHAILQGNDPRALRSFASSLAEIQLDHFQRMYHVSFESVFGDASRAIQQVQSLWIQSIQALAADQRCECIMVRDPRRGGRILGVALGGPLRDSTYIPPGTPGSGLSAGVGVDGEDEGGRSAAPSRVPPPVAELYGLYFASSIAASESALRHLSSHLLSAFSTRMWSKGFTTCYARTHRNERTIFASAARGMDADPSAQQAALNRRQAYLRKGAAGGRSNDASTAAAAMAHASAASASAVAAPASLCNVQGVGISREMLFVWSLRSNLWRRSPAHEDFMSLNGLQVFLDFVLRDTIRIAQVFTSTIRERMEEFGDELQETFARHQDAGGDESKQNGIKDSDDELAATTGRDAAGKGKKGVGSRGKSGVGGAVGIGLGGGGDDDDAALGVDGSSVANGSNSTNDSAIDWSQHLPPPLPVSPYDLGDSPLSGSGLLALLNSPQDNLYKRLFPEMLQELFRARSEELNRCEESPWAQSLLGLTLQENLLTIAANYASVNSVYDERTWRVGASNGNGNRNGKKGRKNLKGGRGGKVALLKQHQKKLSSPDAGGDGDDANGTSALTRGSSDHSTSSLSTLIADPDGHESDLLKHQAEAACAAIFRACYTLVVSGSVSVRRKAATVLRAPSNFYKLRCLMSSFSYGVRSSILDPESPPHLCAMTINFLRLIEELLPEPAVGLEEGLSTLEVLEVFFLVLGDLFSSLLSLLRSRNEHAADPMHACRRLSVHEEKLMGAATALAFKLVAACQTVTLFPAGSMSGGGKGSSSDDSGSGSGLGGESEESQFMVRANIEVRARALQELMLRNKPLYVMALFNFLLYDLENMPDRNDEEEETDEADEDDEGAEDEDEEEEGLEGVEGKSDGSGSASSSDSSTDPLSLRPRDRMRIHILWLLASLFHVSPSLQRDFLHQYQSALITLDLGLRPTLLHSLLAAQQQLIARDKMYQHLIRTQQLDGDEFIVDHAVVEWASSNNQSAGGLGFAAVAAAVTGSAKEAAGMRMLILTNRAYYLSGSLTPGAEGWGWLDSLQLVKRSYADLHSLRRTYGGQGFQLSRYAERSNKRLSAPTPHLELVHEAFVLHQLGLADRILSVFSRSRRDDFGCNMQIGADTLSRPSLLRLYQALNLPNASHLCEHLLTHITIRLRGNFVPRVIVWVAPGGPGGGGGSGTDGMLVISEFDPTALATAPPSIDGHTSSSSSTTSPSDSSLASVLPSGVKFLLSGLRHADFPAESGSMLLAFEEVTLHIQFHDDAAREEWRMKLKRHFLGGVDASNATGSGWKAAMLPSNQQARQVYAAKLL